MVKLNYANEEFVIVTAKTAKDNDFAGIEYQDPVTGQDLVVTFACDAEFFDPRYEEEMVKDHPSLMYFAVRESAREILSTALKLTLDTMSTGKISDVIKSFRHASESDERDEVKKGISDAIRDIKLALGR